MTGIHSDLPGELVAQVSRNVYDSETQQVLLIPRGTRLIGTYDEELQTLRELRRANPGAVGALWDEIDVTLVYPGGLTRSAVVGRHRAAG